MKPLRFALLILTVFALTACIEDITESIEDITESVEDVADSATDLMEEINDISRHVDEKLETGQITEEVADLIDGRLSSIADILESTLQNSGDISSTGWMVRLTMLSVNWTNCWIICWKRLWEIVSPKSSTRSDHRCNSRSIPLQPRQKIWSLLQPARPSM